MQLYRRRLALDQKTTTFRAYPDNFGDKKNGMRRQRSHDALMEKGTTQQVAKRHVSKVTFPHGINDAVISINAECESYDDGPGSSSYSPTRSSRNFITDAKEVRQNPFKYDEEARMAYISKDFSPRCQSKRTKTNNYDVGAGGGKGQCLMWVHEKATLGDTAAALDRLYFNSSQNYPEI